MYNQIANTNEIANCLDFVENYTIHLNGKIKKIDKNNKDFQDLTQNLENLFLNARVMPAFGVSLHDDTLLALETDTWLEINFENEQKINDLPFSSLLIKLEESYGTNLIRKYNNRYDGRCIYLDFMEKVDLTKVIADNNEKTL